MSLQISERQPGDHAGPSAQAQPSKSLCTRAVALIRVPNRSSRNTNSFEAIRSPPMFALFIAPDTVADEGDSIIELHVYPTGCRTKRMALDAATTLQTPLSIAGTRRAIQAVLLSLLLALCGVASE